MAVQSLQTVESSDSGRPDQETVVFTFSQRQPKMVHTYRGPSFSETLVLTTQERNPRLFGNKLEKFCVSDNSGPPDLRDTVKRTKLQSCAPHLGTSRPLFTYLLVVALDVMWIECPELSAKTQNSDE